MKTFILIAFIMAITLSAICAVFYFSLPTNGAWAAVLSISFLGSFTSVFVYLGYKEDKKTTKWQR